MRKNVTYDIRPLLAKTLCDKQYRHMSVQTIGFCLYFDLRVLPAEVKLDV